MNMKENKKSLLGFTLVELLVVMAMTALVSGVMIYNFKSGDRQKKVALSRDAIILSLRTAQNYSLSGKQIPPPNIVPTVRGARCAGDDSPVSYWVEFSDSNIIPLMAEDRCGAVIKVEEFRLVTDTRFSSTDTPFGILNGGLPIPGNYLAVRFTPPFGVMSAAVTPLPFGSDFDVFHSATAKIETNDAVRSRTIIIDAIAGRFE
jgi:type II secretory pathway pseudopilin PulG